MSSICIVDYGVGNIHSALKAFKLYCSEAKMSDDSEELKTASGLVLPGVGAYEVGMNGLRERGLIEIIQNASKDGVPILGICLGAQLLLSTGYEFGEHEGLDLIPGSVKHFPELSVRVPHMGWNEIFDSGSWEGTILEGIGDRPEMYFVHSYIMEPSSGKHRLAETEYGEKRFTSVVRHGNTYGCQFHPEKSATLGLRIVENFVKLVEESA